ncbi:uncharacterized protein V6R79_007844 [Siganus canaliculatus]
MEMLRAAALRSSALHVQVPGDHVNAPRQRAPTPHKSPIHFGCDFSPPSIGSGQTEKVDGGSHKSGAATFSD